MANLTPTEIAAYVGAAAWAPQILTWIYRWFVKPVVEIVPEKSIELGFTTFGPIFNIRLALSAAKKDAIIDHIEVELRHEEGEVRNLKWTGMREIFSKIVDAAGNRQLVEKDQPAIALKVTTVLLTEKFVRFRDLSFHARHRPVLNTLVEHLNYLKKQAEDYRDMVIKSKQFFDIVEIYKTCFWWRPGEYTVNFKIKSRHNANLNAGTFKFSLTQHDTDALRQNLDLISIDYENTTKSDLPEFKPKPVAWNWRNIPLVQK